LHKRFAVIAIAFIAVLAIMSTAACAKVLVRIDTSKAQVALPRGVETVSVQPGQWVDVIIPSRQLMDLSIARINYSVLLWDVEGHERAVAGSYHTLAQMEQILQDIAANYPDITELYSIGTSYQDRPIWCLEISDNPGVDEGEPGVFYMGLHHAREWPTVEICLHIADELTSQYGSDPDITDMVNNRRLWLVPCMNPDGYYYCHDQGHDWRKNRHYFPEFGTYGVDLNRNYAGSCNGDAWGEWGSVFQGAATHGSDSEVYCGPWPFSELETQAIRDVFLSNDICADITWHTYGQEVMWPWGYSTSLHVPDNTYITQVGQQIASRITRESGSGTYSAFQSSGLYPTTGDTDDFAYGYAHYVQGTTTFSYTIEACSEFQPSAGKLDQICAENFDGALYLLQEAQNINDTVVARVMPPVIDELGEDADGNYTVSWHEKNPKANPDYFQLDELKDLSLPTDDAESGSGLWTLDGFSLSTTRSHSASHSYLSRKRSDDVSSMTSVYPLPVTEGMSLGFWCWYNTEDDYDYAFVEVSLDGRLYDVLDKFAGSSGGWLYKEYDLSDYAGESVFIRFRYATDGYTTYEGFYADDISPVPSFGTVTTLSNSIPDHFFNVTGRTEGDYYYRVRGHNPERGWCDFSTLEMITVTGGQCEWTEAPETEPYCNGAQFGAPQGGFPGWVWFSIPLDPGDCCGGDNCYDPVTLLGFDCGGSLWYWDKYLKATQVYNPPFLQWDLAVGDSYLLRLESAVANPGYMGIDPGSGTQFKLGRQGWTWVGKPQDTSLGYPDFMDAVHVQYPIGGETRTATQDRASGSPWVNWGWSFWDTYAQAPKTLTPYASFGNNTAYPWIGYRAYINVGTAMNESDTDQPLLIWP
jgi:hypothetical protein